MSTTLAAPSPEAIRRTAAEVLSDPDFRIEQDTRVGDTIVDLLQRLFELLIAPFRWIFDAMEGLPDFIRWIVVVGLFLLLLLLIGHIVYTLTATLRPSRHKSKFLPASKADPRLSVEEFEQLSQEAISRQDYISAVRYLFKACLTHLQALEGRSLSPGLTNWQYVRRYRKSRFVDSLRRFARVVDASWYGNSVCREEEYLRCKQAYKEIRSQTKEDSHADNS